MPRGIINTAGGKGLGKQLAPRATRGRESGQVDTIWRGTGPVSITATGGDVIGEYVSGGITYKYHQFNNSGTFTVSDASSDFGSTVDLLVVAGGGRGATYNYDGGKGGAGGYRNFTGVSVTAQGYTITVGGNGGNSSALTYSSSAGGIGGSIYGNGGSGGSGGGGGNTNGCQGGGNGGAGNIGGYTPVEGYAGGTNTCGSGMNGGGSAGTNGAGTSNSITGTAVTYAQGGGTGQAQTANTGNGGETTANGQSGVVVLRYRIA